MSLYQIQRALVDQLIGNQANQVRIRFSRSVLLDLKAPGGGFIEYRGQEGHPAVNQIGRTANRSTAAGAKPGDLIASLDGVRWPDVQQVSSLIEGAAEAGRAVSVKVRRDEDVGRHKIVRAEFFGNDINIIAGEGEEKAGDKTVFMFSSGMGDSLASKWSIPVICLAGII